MNRRTLTLLIPYLAAALVLAGIRTTAQAEEPNPPAGIRANHWWPQPEPSTPRASSMRPNPIPTASLSARASRCMRHSTPGLMPIFHAATRCYFQQRQALDPAKPNEDVKLEADAGRFKGRCIFRRRGTPARRSRTEGCWDTTPRARASVSAWLRLNPDQDLEPGYCDPIQVVGNDSKKGYVFLEWSKDDRPRLFRYAILPLTHLWNPDNQPWAEMLPEKRPAVQVARAVLARELDSRGLHAGKHQ